MFDSYLGLMLLGGLLIASEGIWGAILGAAVGLYGAKKQADATKKAASAQQELAEPLLQAQTFALPKIQDLITNYYLKDVGGESEGLRLAHAQSIDDIQRATQKNIQSAIHQFGSIGSKGLAVGEAARMQTAGAKALAQERAKYSLDQENYKLAGVNRALDALTGMSSMGNLGTNLASTAINTQLAGRNEMYGGLAEIGGRLFQTGIDDWLSAVRAKKAANDISIVGVKNT